MVRLSLLSSIGLLGFFSALLFSFLSLWLFFFVTVCVCCCLLAFNLRQHQTLHTPSITTETDTSSSSSTSDIPPPPPLDPNRKLTYDVFLSFRGEDTRKNFTDHLYAALKRNGIHTFRDDEELERGESIAPYLLKAIEESRYAVVVLSRNYANSSWCLDEMAKIVECMKAMGQKVYPVFYDVDPSEVRHQRGDHFGKAFEEHQKRFQGNPHKVRRWKDALSQVANLSGWHLQNRSEAKLIEEIVRKIFTELNHIISISEDLVGMDSYLNEMLSYLDIGRSDDIRIIGICGMGGIGKTTIAQMLSERVRPQFEGYSFLENVREVTKKQGTVHLQQKLLLDLLKINVNVQNTKMGKDIIRFRLKTKRVLIILDDVDQNEQLETLCHREWFGPGSRIIITSRYEHLLSAVDGDEVYKVKPLTDPDALKLFIMKAFKKEQLVGEEFLKLSKEFLKYASGLPLVIKVLGSLVRGRSIELWSSTLDRLKKNPERKVIDVLKVSFDGLEETEKRTFLDIACFFKGYGIRRVKKILQGSDHHLDIDIKVLMEKSMLTLFGRKLGMHDLIQELGWEIVRQECREEPGKRSRLWLPNEIIHVLDRSKGPSPVQSISLEGPINEVVPSINDSFSDMHRLRLLKIWNVKLSGNIKYLSNELQYLAWSQCPLDSFPSNFQPDNLVELLMYSSRIEQLWRGKKGWRMLRVIDMTYSQYLISTPDFTEVPSLEELVLEGCTRLVEVHPSLGSLKKLFRLNMKCCTSVESLPPFTSLESLEFLSLSLCSRLKKFPDIEGNMERLLELHLDGTSIVELPPSVERLTGLAMLNLTDCKSFLHFPSSIQCLTSLERLHLAGCSKLAEMPENLKCVESLEQLYIGGTAIRDLSFLAGMKNLKSLNCQECEGARSLFSPASLSSLTSLIYLDISHCNLMDGDIPDDLSSLISLRELHLCGNCFVRLPESLSQLSKLETLYLRYCRQLESVPKKLQLSLRMVQAEGCTSLTDYPNQIKVLTSEESGVTTVNSLIDSSALVDSNSTRSWNLNDDGSFEMLLIHNRHAEEQRVDRFSLPVHVHLKEAELQTLSNPFLFIEAENEIPEWFRPGTTSTRTPISIPITGDNYDWKGVAACAVFSVNATADAEFSNYWYHFTLETDVVRLKLHVIDWEVDLRPFRSSSDLLLIKYEPRFQFSEQDLNISTVVRASFETNNPFMVVHNCGIRFVFEQDAGWHRTHILPAYDAICLNEDEDDAVLDSGWLSQDPVDKRTLKWEKFIPPSEEDHSTLVLRKNIESVLPRYLEALNHHPLMFKFNLNGSPAWFKYSFGFIDTIPAGSTWRHAPIDMPQNLHKSKKWMGFAIHASFAEEVGHIIEEEEDNYRVYLVLITKGGTPHIVSEKFKHVRPSEEHDQLFVVYIPRAQILESAVLISYMIDSPHVNFRTSGIRVVYQEDIQGLADTIIQCMQKEDSLEFYDKLVVENWIELIRLQGGHLEGISNPKGRDSRTRREKEFELHSQKYINWNWSSSIPVHCTFCRAEIPKWKWFMHFKEGNSAEIQLPPNLFDDANWLGIAVCVFYRLSHEDPNMSVGGTSLDSEYNVLTCRMKSDVDWADLHDLIFQGSIRKPELTEFEHDSTWFYYIPRKCINKFWRGCKLARATVLSSRQWIGVHGCALGLVYKEDVDRLVQTLTSCDLP